MVSRTDQSALESLPGDDLPQIVPSDVCLRCDVCCRFPERESFLRPYFTSQERERAIAAGLDAGLFPEPAGGKIRLIPHPAGEGYICPAFDHTTQYCRIYAVRPLDCRLYPLALMRDEEGRRRLLGLDSKCPYVQDAAHEPQLISFARAMVDRLAESKLAAIVAANPGLTNQYQDDVRIVGEVGCGRD